jgi:hypothetical protein
VNKPAMENWRHSLWKLVDRLQLDLSIFMYRLWWRNKWKPPAQGVWPFNVENLIMMLCIQIRFPMKLFGKSYALKELFWTDFWGCHCHWGLRSKNRWSHHSKCCHSQKLGIHLSVICHFRNQQRWPDHRNLNRIELNHKWAPLYLFRAPQKK